MTGDRHDNQASGGEREEGAMDAVGARWGEEGGLRWGERARARRGGARARHDGTE